MKGFMIFLLFLMASCQPDQANNIQEFKVDPIIFDKLINEKKMPQKPDLQKDLYVVNNDYPIELALYEDGSFYYNLPNLAYGTGKGSWKMKGSNIALHAERDLFDMRMIIRPKNQKGDSFEIEFVDRNGYNLHSLEVVNDN